MGKTLTHFILLSVILVVIQVVLCNNICLFNVAIPIVFIYVLVQLPISLNINWLLTIAFFLGLTVDIFSDTQGINALACTMLAFTRRTILKLYFPRGGDLPDAEPSSKMMGVSAYLKYMLTMVFIYCILVFFIESFSFFNFAQLCIRIIASTILSFAIIWGIDRLTTNRHREKRL